MATDIQLLWEAYDHIVAAIRALGDFYEPADIKHGDPHPFDADRLLGLNGGLLDQEMRVLESIRARGDTSDALVRPPLPRS